MAIFTRAFLITVCVLWVAAIKADDLAQYSLWSAPENLGSTVNSTAGDFFAFISKDGLSLYFTSATCGTPAVQNCRNDGYGGWDIYVSQRATVNDPWGPPNNLGPTINTPNNEGGPSLSVDGHLMYFASNRPGGIGGNDIYVSRRHNKRDDFGWQYPENLGRGVNTGANEASPEIFEDDDTGVTTLYFDSTRPDGPGPSTVDLNGNGNDIYASILQSDETFGPAALVAELSSSSVDRQPTIRRDGLEMYLASTRTPTYGNLDLWVSVRATTSDLWSNPVNVGSVVNSAGNDAGPALSFDRKTLYFQSNRSGLGQFDLFMSSRTKLKDQEKDKK